MFKCRVSVVSSGPWLSFGLSFCLHRPILADRCSLEGPSVILTHFPGCSFLTGFHSTQVHLSRSSIARSSWCRLVLRLARFVSPLTNFASLLFLPSCQVSAMNNSLGLTRLHSCIQREHRDNILICFLDLRVESGPPRCQASAQPLSYQISLILDIELTRCQELS